MSTVTKSQLREWVSGCQYKLQPTHMLSIDASYQRLETTLAIYISESFDSLSFGTLTVGQRPRDQFFVVDGQQRLKAARLLHFQTVPCLIFRSTGRAHEARIFKEINQYRKRVSKLEIFRAAITAKSKTALDILSIVREAGFDVHLKTRKQPAFGWPNLSCISMLEKIYMRQAGPAALKAAVLTVADLWPGEDDACRTGIIGGMDLFLGQAGKKLDRHRLKDKVGRYVAAEIVRDADIWKAKQRGTSGYGRSESVATVIWKRYNSRARSK